MNNTAPKAVASLAMSLAVAAFFCVACEGRGAQAAADGELNDAERQRIVESVVPDEPFEPSLELCENEAGPRIDARGEVYRTDHTGLSIEAPGCILGAKVIGTFDRGLGWADVKRDHDGDGIRWSHPAPGLVHVIGSYIDNIEDPIGPPKSPETDRRSTWKVEHVYARYARDDFVENDACLDGHVHDSLADGTHVFISARPGRSNQAEMAKHAATHTVTNSLVHLDCKPDPRTDTRGSCPPGTSTMIPAKWSACGGTLNIKDTIIRIDGRARMGTKPMAFPPGEYENVWLIYLGPEDSYPGNLPPSGVTEVRDLGLWRMARQKWLQRHGCDAAGDHCIMLDE